MSTEFTSSAKSGALSPTHQSTRISFDSIWDRDERELAKLGKKSQLRRNFALLSVLGFSCSIMVTWEGMLVVFTYGLNNGGPAGLIYGFLFCWLGYGAVVATLSELVSMAPTAGGQYHWTYMLAARRSRNALSYLVGWQTVIAWQATTASAAYLAATVIQGLVILNYPNYVSHYWQGTLLTIAIAAISLLFNTVFARVLPQVENSILMLHLSGFVVVLVTVTVLSPTKSSAHDVFVAFSNNGGFDTKGLAFFVGLLSAVFAFIGADGAVHMCEEIKNASSVVPWGLTGSILINGVLGFAMVIAVLFCIGDLSAATSSPTGYPFIEILTEATRSVAGGTGLTSIIVALFVSATIAVFAACSRMMWSFARDMGLPGSAWLQIVDKRSKLPLYSLFTTAAITTLLSLINIGGGAAFNAVISLVVSGFLGSYIIPFSLLFYRRVTDPSLEFGPWRLGRFGVFVNAFAIVWSLIAMFFSFFPQQMNPTAATMNWNCLMYGASMLFSILFYVVYGRFRWSGPLIEIDGGMVLA